MTLLPPNASPLERALDEQADRRLGAIPSKIAGLWSAATCPVALLPWLAWALSVDEWDERWPEAVKRRVIEEAPLVHRQKGTPAAIKRALAAIGQPDAGIIERGDYIRHNGSTTRNGSHLRRGQGGWSTYRIILRRPATIDQALQIKRLLASVQRNCIELTAIEYRQAAIRRNGAAIRNRAYTRGVINTTITN